MTILKSETKQIIDRLKVQYKDDCEALEEINRRISDIEYVEKKEAQGNYKGQSSLGIAMSLEGHLITWY